MRQRIPLFGIAAMLSVLIFGSRFGLVYADSASLPKSLDSYRHIHSFVVDDPENPLFGMHHFYANPSALRALGRGGPYPKGAVFLGAVYKLERDGPEVNETEPAGWTLMRRDPRAEDTGGWRFAQFKPDGTRVELDEARDCFHCHTQVEDRHYVFSRPLDLALPRP
jgi:hypothetical protein